jgi:hypothetical protein
VADYDVIAVRRVPQSAGAPQLVDVGPIRWTGLAWTREAGAAGGATVSCGVDLLDDAVKGYLADLVANPLEIWLYRDGTQLAAGPVTAYQIKNRQITITAAGLLYYLGYMVQDVDFFDVGGDVGTIAPNLIDTWQALTYGHYGIDTAHVAATGVTRDVTLRGADLRSLARVVEDLGQDATAGFELAIDPATRQLAVFAPRMGSDLSAAVFLDARSIAASDYRQLVTAGRFGSEAEIAAVSVAGTNMTGTAANTAVRQSFGRAGITGSARDVKDPTEAAARASRLLADNDQASHVVAPDLLAVEGFGYGDFGPGDIITYDYDAGLGRQTFPVRVKSITISPDSGEERLAITVV